MRLLRVCVCSLALSLPCCCPVGTTASSATEPFAASRISSLRAKLPWLLGGTCLGLRLPHGQRSYCQLPPASRVIDVSETHCIDGRVTVYCPPPRVSAVALSTLLSKVCPSLSVRCGLRAHISPPAAAQSLCLVFVPSCNASLAFRAWPCTSVLRTPVGAPSQRSAAGGHRLRHERLERGLACATEPEPQSVSTVSDCASVFFRVRPKTRLIAVWYTRIPNWAR